MKKLFLLFTLAAICFAAPLRAQENSPLLQPSYEELPKNAVMYHHEVFAGYGLLTLSDILTTTVSALLTVTTLAAYSEQNLKLSGSLLLGYKYRFNKVVSLGGTYAYGACTGDAYKLDNLSPPTHAKWGSVRNTYHTFAAEADFRYLTRKVITLYSTIGLGASLYSRKMTPDNAGESPVKACMVHPTVHVSLLGAKIGTYRAGGYLEAGFGYKGVLNLGAYVRF